MIDSADPVVTPHREYQRMGPHPVARQRTYQGLFADVLDGDRIAQIRAYLQQRAPGRCVSSSREAMLGDVLKSGLTTARR